jgi:hypothetical protein
MLEEHPLWVHVTRQENRERIAEQGLLPWDEVGQPVSDDDECFPREGCVYLCSAQNWEQAALLAGDHEDPLLVAVDMRGIARARILPDEDDWSGIICGIHVPEEYGIPPYDKERFGSGRAWAEAVRLGEQPFVCELAVENEQICVRGRIAPELLQIQPDDGHPYAAAFWIAEIQQRHRGTFDPKAAKAWRRRADNMLAELDSSR